MNNTEVNVIPVKTYKTLASTTRIPLRRPTVNLIAYNRKPTSVKAMCDFQCVHRGEEYVLEFYISKSPSDLALSVAVCKKLNLVRFTQELRSELVQGDPAKTTPQVLEDRYSKQIQTEYFFFFWIRVSLETVSQGSGSHGRSSRPSPTESTIPTEKSTC